MLVSPRWLPVALLCLCPSPVISDEVSHDYEPGELLKVWADRTGPYRAPRETYSLEDLPLCELWGLEDVTRRPASFAEALEGRGYPRLSPRIRIQWPGGDENSSASAPQEICRMRLTREVSHTIRELVKDQYYYSYLVDDLPAYAFLGELDNQTGNPEVKLFAHKTFVLERNGNRLVGFSIVPKEPVSLMENRELRFTYDTVWIDSNVSFAQRFNRFFETSFFQDRIQWFSLMTSGLLVAFMVALTGAILFRTLKHDVGMEERDPEAGWTGDSGLERTDEAGWRLLAKDVFRRQPQLLVHTVICASGAQLMATAILVSVLALGRIQWWGGPAVSTSVILWCFALSQPLNGFIGAVLYKSSGGKKWNQTVTWQICGFPLIVVLLRLQLNTVHVVFGTTGALSLGEMFTACFLFLVVLFPLHVLGVYLGRRHAASFAKPPVKPNALERPVPPMSWIVKFGMVLLSGALPFGCLFVDAFLILGSMWTFRSFYVYSFLLATLLLYMAAVATSVVTAVYLLLNNENYHWQWFSLCCGASPALYLIIYAAYYRHIMFPGDAGLLQNTAYWTSMAMVTIGVATASAAVGHLAANQFIRTIYTNVKRE